MNNTLITFALLINAHQLHERITVFHVWLPKQNFVLENNWKIFKNCFQQLAFENFLYKHCQMGHKFLVLRKFLFFL